jgi:hypothetical protein
MSRYERQGCSRAVVLHRGRPAQPDPPTISPSTLMGNPPPHAATRESVGMPAKSDGSPWIKLKKSCVETPNGAVYDRGPIHPAECLEIAPVIENRCVFANANFSGFCHGCIHLFYASSEEMLCFFTTLAIGLVPPFDMCCVLIIPHSRNRAGLPCTAGSHCRDARSCFIVD